MGEGRRRKMYIYVHTYIDIEKTRMATSISSEALLPFVA